MKNSAVLLRLILLLSSPALIAAQLNSTSTSSSYYASATDYAYSGSSTDGDGPSSQAPEGSAGSSPTDSGANNDAGASGSTGGFVNISRGGQAAIIVVIVLVAIGGIASAVLFYLAKKRSWEVRKTLRRSARRLTTSLASARLPGTPRTPKTPKFPRDHQRGASRQRDQSRDRHYDVEKGTPNISAATISTSGTSSKKPGLQKDLKMQEKGHSASNSQSSRNQNQTANASTPRVLTTIGAEPLSAKSLGESVPGFGKKFGR